MTPRIRWSSGMRQARQPWSDPMTRRELIVATAMVVAFRVGVIAITMALAYAVVMAVFS